jgi:hypothetical protein
MLTVTGAGDRHGGAILVRHLRFPPLPQPSNESIARTMLRELLLLAVIIALIIAGILIQLWR